MDKLSAVLITKNEARNLEPCVAAARRVADEIVVVDSGSTDGTQDLARRLGARVIEEPWRGFGAQKNFGDAAATHDWILSLDADEILDEALQASILSAKARGLTGAYELTRRNWYYGRFLRHGFEYPDRKVRLFHRSTASWSDDRVHEVLRLPAGTAVARLDGHLHHYTYRRVEEHVAKGNRYTDLAAEEARRRGKRPTLSKLVLGPAFTFFKAYVLKRGFLDGRHGYMLACLHANAAFLKQAKLWDLWRTAAEQGADRPPAKQR